MMYPRLTTLAAGAALCMLVSPAVAAQQTGHAPALAR